MGGLMLYMVVQAIFGVLAIEWALSKTVRFRTLLDEQYQDPRLEQIKRRDAAKWTRWRLYPAAMLTLLTRVIILIFNVVICVTMVKIWTCGHNFRKGPIRKGLRQRIISFQFRIAGKIFMMLTGVYWSSSDLDVDYTYYLGPGYKETMSKKYASTIISNHVSWLDGMVIATRVLPSMTPKASLKKTPIVSTLGYAIGNVWIPRGTSQEDRDKALELIKDRQELVGETGNYPPLLIYPEGTTTDGKFLYNFRKGAFVSEKKIQPMILKYSNGSTVDPCWDIVGIKPMIILQLSWFCHTVHMYQLPDFEPNEYLFQTHKDKGETRWEIYAWAMRSIMLEHGGFESSSLTFREKQNYANYMNDRKGNVHPDEFYKFINGDG